MKKTLFFLSFFTTLASIKSHAQNDVSLSVVLLNSSDTTYNLTPQTLMIRWEDLNSTMDTVIAYYELRMPAKSMDSTSFLFQETFQRGKMKIPYSQYKTAFKNGAINYTTSDAILQKLKLKTAH